MSRVRNMVTYAARNSKRRPKGWYVARIGYNGRVRAFTAGPFADIQQALTALNR